MYSFQSMPYRVFIGSSTEALPAAREIGRGLESFRAGQRRVLDVRIWDRSFELSEIIIEGLERNADLADFAIFVLAPDDLSVRRHKEIYIPRDNTIYELGLFTGRLERRRTIIVRASNPPTTLPSDLAGIIYAQYDHDAVDKGDLSSLRKNVLPKLKKHILKVGCSRIRSIANGHGYDYEKKGFGVTLRGDQIGRFCVPGSSIVCVLFIGRDVNYETTTDISVGDPWKVPHSLPAEINWGVMGKKLHKKIKPREPVWCVLLNVPAQVDISSCKTIGEMLDKGARVLDGVGHIPLV